MGYKIKTVWTDKITDAEIEDFRYVVNTVFGGFCTEEYFRAKYLDNIYGPSLLIIAYLDGKPVGANSLWRNDIGGKEAYQSAETSVIHSVNSGGVFASMLLTMKRFASEKKGAPFVAFPNKNSFPGFQKLKWSVRWNHKVFFIPGISLNSRLPRIDGDYALWWLIRRRRVGYIKRFGKYYLVKANKHGCILGIVDRDVALRFPKLEKKYAVLYYESDRTTFYNHNMKIRPLAYCNVDDVQMPYWRRDGV